MPKRKPYGGDGLHAGKKQKTNHVHEAPTSEEVYTGRQLRNLLTFEQDLQKARHGELAVIAIPFTLIADAVCSQAYSPSKMYSIAS